MTEFKAEYLTGNNNIASDRLVILGENPTRTTSIKFFCWIVVFGHTPMTAETNCTYKC